MTHGSLFSGIGGFDLAAEWMGWENIFHCEWNPFGQKVLKYYWPNAISYENICTTDFTVHRGKVDIITGGFPCQPYSLAGKRLGKEDERHLWPEMLRTIREVQPRWVVGENVFGLVNWSGGLVFHEVQADLEAQGYEVQPYILPAVSVNAPHRRDRVWFVAHSISNGDGKQQISYKESIGEEFIYKSQISNVTDTNCNGFNKRNIDNEINSSERRFDAFGNTYKSNEYGNVTNTTNIRREDALENGKLEGGRLRQSYKRNAWDSFPSVSPICIGDDGLSEKLDGITFSKWRKESIKAGGNAIVPQVAYQIFKTIEQYERSRTTKEDC
jgi:DNA (cytosine-5)-methyltransferase 1